MHTFKTCEDCSMATPKQIMCEQRKAGRKMIQKTEEVGKREKYAAAKLKVWIVCLVIVARS